MAKSPCMGCVKREVGCHGRCGAYKEFRAAIDAKNAKRNEIVNKENIVRDVEWTAKRKMNKRKRGWR